MGTGDMLLRAILEQPGEDTPRLVYADWLDENGEQATAATIRTGLRTPTWLWTSRVLVGADLFVTQLYRRGFVERVELPAAAFTEDLARALFSAHPVIGVVLSDIRPIPVQPVSWLAWDGAELHPDVYDRLRWDDRSQGHDGELRVAFRREDAAPALSDACVSWGRELAGLTPLDREARNGHG